MGLAFSFKSGRPTALALGLFILAVVSVVTSRAEPAAKSPEAASLSIARAMIDRRFADVRALFDPKLSAALTEAAVASGWTQTTEPMGPLLKIGTPKSQQFGPYAIATVPLVYQKGPINLVITLTADGKIAGIFLKPGDASASR